MLPYRSPISISNIDIASYLVTLQWRFEPYGKAVRASLVGVISIPSRNRQFGEAPLMSFGHPAGGSLRTSTRTEIGAWRLHLSTFRLNLSAFYGIGVHLGVG